MIQELTRFIDKPTLYASSTNQFWKDAYISKFVLESHLNPNEEAATRKPAFLDQSVTWITEIAPPSQFNNLLDLGCGPGLYAERFNRAKYTVTGIDFSQRSIEYASKQADIQKKIILFTQDLVHWLTFC